MRKICLFFISVTVAAKQQAIVSSKHKVQHLYPTLRHHSNQPVELIEIVSNSLKVSVRTAGTVNISGNPP